MKKFSGVILIALALVLSVSATVLASEKGHYPLGVEGIKGASIPPPGFYWRSYSLFYNANELTGKNGDKLPVGFDVSVIATVERFIYVSNKKFLGANYGADFLVPLVSTDLKVGAAGIDNSEFSLGDIYLEPLLLSWHGRRTDTGFGLSFFAPTGSYDIKKPASPGMDFWTFMLTLGTTLYLDEQKTWSGSVLGRYEIHSEKGDMKITPGNDLLIEWGLAKNVNKIWDIGLAGYAQWQVSDDSGADVTYDKSLHDKVYAMGPEVSVFIMKAKLFLSLRSVWEFGAEDRSQGNTTCVTLTKIF